MTDANSAAPLLRISGDFNIFTALAMKEELLTCIASAPENTAITVDLSEVTDIDTAGIQLLLLTRREAAALGKTARFVRHSDPVLDLFALWDLAGQFGDPLPPRS